MHGQVQAASGQTTFVSKQNVLWHKYGSFSRRAPSVDLLNPALVKHRACCGVPEHVYSLVQCNSHQIPQ